MESDPTDRPLMDYRWDSPLYVNSKCPKREQNPILPFRYSERTRRREGGLEKSLETWSKFYMQRLREIPSPSHVMHNKARQASLITSLVTFITRETSALSVWIWGKLDKCTAVLREAWATLPESSSWPLPAAATLAQSRNLAHASLETAVHLDLKIQNQYCCISLTNQVKLGLA